jgi:diguanylate cyclase
MSQLGSMPLRTIKIDRSFVTHLADDASGQVLVKAIVDLAHEFGLVAVAEGVEDEAAIAKLRSMGCDVAQGYHWSRPVAAADVMDVVARLDSGTSASLTSRGGR